MDLRERQGDMEELIRTAIEQHMSRVWNSLPGTVVPGSYDATKQTVSVQPSVKGYVKKEDGTQQAVDLPVLPDVPVQFPAGGGVSMTFPIKGGEEVLVSFSSRSPDNWQQSGGQQQPADTGVGGLSGGFAMLGFRSNPRALTDVDTEGVVIRSDDNMTKVGLSPASGVSVDTDQQVTIAAAQGVGINSGAGPVAITGVVQVTGDVVINGISFMGHMHTGVVTGGDDTGIPVGA